MLKEILEGVGKILGNVHYVWVGTDGKEGEGGKGEWRGQVGEIEGEFVERMGTCGRCYVIVSPHIPEFNESLT